jgi:AcrR family transcriptional regulator
MHSQAAEDRTLRTLWDAGPTASPGPRPRFSVREIAAAGVSLADARGLGGVSLAAVAERLGLTTTALYRYVDSKDSLIALMVDSAVGPPPEAREQDWRAAVEGWVRSLWGQYLAHHWLTDVPARGMPRYPQQLAWIELLLRELDRGCVRDSMNTALVLDGLARTFGVLAHTGHAAPPPPAWLVEAAAARFPRLSRELNRDWTNIEDEFTEALNTVLRGAASPSSGAATSV